jgi:hypothetical protein
MALKGFDLSDPNTSGIVYCWGDNGAGYDGTEGGRLGNGEVTGEESTPVIVLAGQQDPNHPRTSYLKNIVAISAGEAHSMALDMYGNVWIWGDNDFGQLGTGTNDPCTTPVRVVGRNGAGYLENIVAIAAGYWHSIAVDSDGTVWTWGRHDEGRLGLCDISQNDSITPHPIGVVYNLSQQTFNFGIQPAINDANEDNEDGDVLEASPATYFENVDFLTKTVTLKSTDPNNWGIVQNTIIYESGLNEKAIDFYDNYDSTLSGFTITAEKLGLGGYGIRCDSSSSCINNCIIENCGSYGLYGLNNSSVVIDNCRFLGNGSSGIRCSYSDVNVSGCLIRNNDGNGIYCNNSDIIVNQCWIKNNGGEGINIEYPSSAYITNNKISYNNDNGIYSSSSSSGKVEIKNNWIYANGADGSGNGIYIYNDSEPYEPFVIRNNTVANDANYGIELQDYYPGWVNVSNCIIWDNPDGELVYCTATYSCVKNGSTNNNNINDDPCFVNDANDNYHIGPGSPCIDRGTGNFPDETDIDGEERTVNGATDMGADEFYRSPCDFDEDGYVNFVDYSMFATAWATKSGEQDYNDIYDLEDNDVIDYNDLSIFCDHWLWVASWATASSQQMMMAMGGGFDSQSTSIDSFNSSPLKLELPQTVYMSPQQTAAVIADLLDWLDELWEQGDIKESMTYEEYLEFRESIKESIPLY